MTPPTNIDGTDITGATIDGQEVQQITVDGDVVFSLSGGNLPVAYGNLVAWYPFDADFYGGSNFDDVTARFQSQQSGNPKAFDANILTAPDHFLNDGVTDINDGSSSGHVGPGELQVSDFPDLDLEQLTVSAWVFPQQFNQSFGNIVNRHRSRLFFNNDFGFALRFNNNITNQRFAISESGGANGTDGNRSLNTLEWAHLAGTFDGSRLKLYVNGTLEDDIAAGPIKYESGGMSLLAAASDEFRGKTDDIRIYNRALSASEIDQMYLNTEV